MLPVTVLRMVRTLEQYVCMIPVWVSRITQFSIWALSTWSKLMPNAVLLRMNTRLTVTFRARRKKSACTFLPPRSTLKSENMALLPPRITNFGFSPNGISRDSSPTPRRLTESGSASSPTAKVPAGIRMVFAPASTALRKAGAASSEPSGLAPNASSEAVISAVGAEGAFSSRTSSIRMESAWLSTRKRRCAEFFSPLENSKEYSFQSGWFPFTVTIGLYSTPAQKEPESGVFARKENR